MADKRLSTLSENCLDKIEILHSQGSQVCAHKMVEFIENKEKRELAVSLLICFEKRITELLVANFSVMHIKAVQKILARKEGLEQARIQRKKALFNFYREISAAEFSSSPLGLRLQDPDWLAPLSSTKILQLMLNIKTELLAALLSCLSPLRVSKAILLCRSDDDKQKIMTGLEAINLVNEEDVDNLLRFLQDSKDKFAIYRWSEPQTARYLGEVISNLKKEDSYQFLDAIQSKPRLLTELQDCFLPFEAVSHLQPDQIRDILSERPEKQIAQILFNTDEMTRDTVLNVLPEVTRLGVREKLQTLESDRTTNLGISSKLQLKVRNYLQSISAT